MAATTQTPPLTERELAAWRGFLRAHALLVKKLDADLESAHGLPLASYEVLLRLHQAGDGRMRMHDLAESIALSRSGLTRLVDRLERDGLVERVSCSSDKRGAFAQLTAEGHRRLDDARATHLDGVREHFLRHFSDAELDGLAEAWRRVAGACGCSGRCV